MVRDFQRVDLSRMIQLPKCAIMCRTAGDTETFFHNLVEQFDERLFWDLNDIMNIWNNYREQTGFTLYLSDDEPSSISYCHEEWFRNFRYELVEFEDLTNPVEIEESEMSLDVLMGDAF